MKELKQQRIPGLDAFINPPHVPCAGVDFASSDFGENPNPAREIYERHLADMAYKLGPRVRENVRGGYNPGEKGPNYVGFVKNFGALVKTNDVSRMKEGLVKYFPKRFGRQGTQDLRRYAEDESKIIGVFLHMIDYATSVIERE